MWTKGHQAISRIGNCGFEDKPRDTTDSLVVGRFSWVHMLTRETNLSKENVPGAIFVGAACSLEYLYRHRSNKSNANYGACQLSYMTSGR